jgi:hypothetical protein
MAVDAQVLTTYMKVGNREDLSDEIFRIDPTETPFFTMCEKVKATSTKHEWQTQALDGVNLNNAVLEGDDAQTDTLIPTVRLFNRCQISDKVARVTGTQQASDPAGIDGDELSYQETLKGLELKRDVEAILLSLQAQTAPGSLGIGTARKTSSVLAYLGMDSTKPNTNKGTGAAADPAVNDGSVVRTDGTQRALAETQLKDVLQKIWNNGGRPGTIMLNGFQKQAFSMFQGRAATFEDATTRTIVAAVDTYKSDFGTLKLVANRWVRSRDLLVFQEDMWAVGHMPGRKMLSISLAKTGDSDRRQMLTEYVLESRNQLASGGVFDLTTV